MTTKSRFLSLLVFLLFVAAPGGVAFADDHGHDHDHAHDESAETADAEMAETPEWPDTVLATYPGGELRGTEFGARLEEQTDLKSWPADFEPMRKNMMERLRGHAAGNFMNSGEVPEPGSPVGIAIGWNHVAEKRAVARSLYEKQGLPDNAAVTDEEVEAFYEENRADYVTPPRVSFQYLFLNRDTEGAAELAADLSARLVDTPTSFTELVDEYSESSMPNKSMPIGPVGRTTMLPEMATVLFDELTPGDISGVIELTNGYAIVRLVSRADEQERHRPSSLMNIRHQLEGERLAAILEAKVAELKEAHPFELLSDTPPANWDEATDNAVVTVDGRSINERDLMCFLVFEGRYGHTPEAWATAAEAAHGMLIDIIAAEQLIHGADLEEAYAARGKSTEDWARQTAQAIGYAPITDEQRAQAREALYAAFAKFSTVEGRVLYVRPGDRADEQRQVVPRSEVIAEIERALAAIEGGMSMEDAIREFSTAPDAAEGGAVVSSDDPELPADIAVALREGTMGRVSGVIQLPTGYCLVYPERRTTPWPASDAEIDWMVDSIVVRMSGGRLRSNVQRIVEQDEVEVDQDAFGDFVQVAMKRRAALIEQQGGEKPTRKVGFEPVIDEANTPRVEVKDGAATIRLNKYYEDKAAAEKAAAESVESVEEAAEADHDADTNEK